MPGKTRLTSRRSFLRSGLAVGGLVALGLPTAAACSSTRDDPSRITFLTGEDSTDTQAVWERMFHDFTASNNTVREVVPEYLNPDQALSRLATLVNTGTPPDIAKFDDAEIAVLARGGVLEPVTDVVNELQVPDNVRMRIGGEDYFIPTDLGSSFMYYRRDWFDEAGVRDTPQDWDSYLTVAEALTDRSRRRFGDLVVSNSRSGYTKNVTLNHTWSSGVDYFRWDNGRWTISLLDHREAAVATLDWFKKRSAFSPQTANYDYSEATQAIASGAVGMMEYPGARTMAYLAKEFPDVFAVTGVAPLPYKVRPARKFSIGGLVIFKKAGRSPTPAKELALSMARGQSYLDYLWSVPGQLIPPNRAVFTGEWRSHEFIQSTPGLLAAIDDAYRTGYSALTGPSAPPGADTNVAASAIFLSTVYSELISKTVIDELDPNEILESATTEMQEYFDEMS